MPDFNTSGIYIYQITGIVLDRIVLNQYNGENVLKQYNPNKKGYVMNYRDRLLNFNSQVLLNKKEILESFDDFVLHHQEKDNEEGYSEGKRKTLLSLCERFRNEL